jgi:hypothetical protein
MSRNKYIARLVRNYSDTYVAEIAEEAATLTPEELGIDEKELDRISAIIFEKMRERGINIDSIEDEKLMQIVLRFWGNILDKMRKSSSSTIDDEDIMLAAELLSQELANVEISMYRSNYSGNNKVFYSEDTFKKFKQAMHLGLAYIIVLIGGKLKASEIKSYIERNQPIVEMVIDKVAAEDTIPRDNVIKYRKDVKTEKTPLELATEEIKHHIRTDLRKVYFVFAKAGAFTPTSKSTIDSVDIYDKLSVRMLKAARILYREIPRGEQVPLGELLSQDDTTATATKYLVLAAMSYDIMSQIKYEDRGFSSEQVEKIRHILRNGEYEIKFKDKENRTVKKFTPQMTIYVSDELEIDLAMHWIQVLGLKEVDDILKQSEFYNILRHNLTRYKCAIAPVKGTPLYDIYVVLPVVVKMGTTNPIHEVAFRIRCNLDVETSLQSQPNTVSAVSPNVGLAKILSTKTRLFRKKRKYDWM